MTHIDRVEWPSRSSTRSRISCAALLVKVIARISPGRATPEWISHAIRCVSTRVLPEPAPARTSSGPPGCSTASRWGSFRPSSRLSRRSAAAASGIGSMVVVSPTYPPAMGLSDDVRRHCAAVAAQARSVRIDATALDGVEPAEPPDLDPQVHYLEGAPADVARYLLALDAINFGSGWFPLLDKRPGLSGYFTVAWNMSDEWRANGPWSPADLRSMTTERIAAALRQNPALELMSLFAQALRELGRLLGDRDAVDLIEASKGSAQALAATLANGCALFGDRGFYKRAQITANDLALAGIAQFDDLDELTIFADNLVPHVLRCDGVLVYDDALAAHIDAAKLLPAGSEEREIRACAVHACELIAARQGVPSRVRDIWLWNRG